MSTEMIMIAVDPRAAQAYYALSEEDQRKIGALLSLRVLEATQTTESLEDLMRRISQNARQRGLTPEILDDILNDDDDA
jgi:N-acetylglutamate synthase-like GNAT family acetyltransferase